MDQLNRDFPHHALIIIQKRRRPKTCFLSSITYKITGPAVCDVRQKRRRRTVNVIQTKQNKSLNNDMSLTSRGDGPTKTRLRRTQHKPDSYSISRDDSRK